MCEAHVALLKQKHRDYDEDDDQRSADQRQAQALVPPQIGLALGHGDTSAGIDG
jgi:hypothetical protein